jgi:hypothetical protein
MPHQDATGNKEERPIFCSGDFNSVREIADCTGHLDTLLKEKN